MKEANLEERIAVLKKGIEEAKRLRTQAETQKEMLLSELQTLTEEIRKFGLEPEDLEREIAALEKEIEELLREAERMIPWDLLREGQRG